jgi:hypothetical protein
MKKSVGLSVLICLAAFAQEKQPPAAVGGGHIPARGPASAKPCTAQAATPAPGRQPGATTPNFIAVDEKGHPYVPHVDVKNDRWVGHDTCADDPHYHLDHPWAHGRYSGGLGPQRVFPLALDKVSPGIAEWLALASGHLWFGNFYWNIAQYDYDIAARWKWDSDQIAIYEDPVHVGWYLAYTPRLGSFAHVEYLGAGAPPKPAAGDSQAAPRKPRFENDQVIVNEPHAKMHVHRYNRVMIYASQGGEWLHYLDGHTEDLKWQAGQVKWSPASGMHYSEIPTTSEVPQGPGGLDIGIKKPGNAGKVVTTALDPLRVDPKDYKVEFENSQVRVVRVRLGPRQSVPMHEYVLNRVVYYATDENVRETSPDGKAVVAQHKAGDFSWDGPAKQKVENLNDKPFEALVVEVKN